MTHDLPPIYAQLQAHQSPIDLEWIANVLPHVVAPPAIRSEGQYRCYLAIFILLDAACFAAFNVSGSNLEDSLYQVKQQFADRLREFNRRHLAQGRDANLIARYLLTGRSFTAVPVRTAMLVARAEKVLGFKRHLESGQPVLYVVGIERKIGDNLFTVTRSGRHYRKFRDTIGRQAFVPSKDHDFSPAELEIFCHGMTELDDSYRVTWVGNFKGGSRESSFDRQARGELYALLSGPWANALTLSPPCDTRCADPGPAVVEVEQLPLAFAA